MDQPTVNGKVTSSLIGALEVKLNGLLGKYDRLTDGSTDQRTVNEKVTIQVQVTYNLQNETYLGVSISKIFGGFSNHTERIITNMKNFELAYLPACIHVLKICLVYRTGQKTPVTPDNCITPHETST